jgi:mono/diheme cytochrome c family protein
MPRWSFGAAALALIGMGTVVAGAAAPKTDTPAFAGRRLWLKENCYGCHGPHAGGGIAVRIQGLGSLVPYAVGGGFAGFGMPNFSSQLTSTDISNLSAYVNVAGTPAEPTFLQWWKAVPQN